MSTQPHPYQLTWYNISTALWMVSFSMQQLLVTWILVGILHESPQSVGLAQMLIGIPALIFMLWGGAIGDRVDGRQLLIQAHLFSAIPPLILALAASQSLLGYWLLIAMALAAGLLNSLSNPARFTILNKVAGSRLQYAISLSTGIGLMATIVGTKVAGELENIGLNTVLYLQSALFLLGAVFVAGLAAVPVKKPTVPALQTIRDGLHHVWQFKLARDLIALNTLSSFFNAGAWMVAVPFIITKIYDGDAVLFANMAATFYFGSLLSNFGLLRYLPLQRPGRLYLIMQLSRIPVLFILWLQPNLWIFWAALGFWGFNMGITSTMSRLMIQEFSEPQFRSRVMSIFTLGMMSAAPVGSLVLGFVIALAGPLNALLPGMFASVVIFAVGLRGTQIWHYCSPVTINAEN